VRLAEEGADIIAVDICAPIASVPYAMASEDELVETAALVQARGRRVVARKADVRSRAELDAAVQEGLSRFGRVDISIANAGILPIPSDGVDDEQAWQDALDVMLTGAWNTIKATTPAMIDGGRGGSLILINSTAGSRGISDGSGGVDGYGAAKHGLVGLMRMYANILGPHSIRVNTVHPTPSRRR
jgi:NAD(P)-dependent dehydrogenase (short-subunit alcohol dehydrogenase family)